MIAYETIVKYVATDLCNWCWEITPQVERKKKNVEKSHKSACVCPMF